MADEVDVVVIGAGQSGLATSHELTEAGEELDLRGFGAVIFAGGYRPAYDSWIDCPGAFDELGFPVHREGASTAAPGLYFVGVHFQRKRKSALLLGVGEDAAIVARQVASRDPVPAP